MKWKKSQAKKGTPVITAEESSSMTKKAISKKCGLQAINDIYIIEEDPVEMSEYDTGISAPVSEALKKGRLIIPDAYKNFAEKFPCRGTVISKGHKTKQQIKVGDKVIYARLGVQRYVHNGKTLCDVRERDIHAVVV